MTQSLFVLTGQKRCCSVLTGQKFRAADMILLASERRFVSLAPHLLFTHLAFAGLLGNIYMSIWCCRLMRATLCKGAKQQLQSTRCQSPSMLHAPRGSITHAESPSAWRMHVHINCFVWGAWVQACSTRLQTMAAGGQPAADWRLPGP